MFSTFRISISFLLILIILAISSRSFALEMSSKRDCVVCHIMWMDDFRTDKETLIEWQPGNVLMKDTQGVVSSEAICYSCHDGYVNDSRYIVWKYNRHKTFVRPSKNVVIPDELPLSVKGEIYCGTCHSAHGRGAAPQHGNPLGVTSVYRETNIDSSLCELCHKNEAAYKFSNGHPVHTTALELPDILFSLGSKRATKKNMVICQTCHKVHGAKGDKILIIDNSNSELCIICHEKQRTLISTKHDLRLTMPDEKNIRQEPLSKSGPCGACHVPHNSVGKKLWARPLKQGNPASQMCLTCHGEDTRYKTKRIGKYSHPINVRADIKEEIFEELPLFSYNGEKIPDGGVQCLTCHDVHRWDPNYPDNRGGKDIEGDASNSFLRISNLSSELCIKCHFDKQQLLTSDHNLEITAPEEKNIQGFNAKISGPCGACHVPHNAAGNRLWARTLSEDKEFTSQLCTGCHSENGIAKSKVIKDFSHPIGVTLERLGLTTKLPLYDNEGNVTVEGKIMCLTCHEPHIWDPNREILNYKFKNIEGDASNSFLRIANSPSSGLCESCHKEKAYIEATEHDLNITAPDARNILGQTVKESGVCGACHIVHNGPNKIRLWARAYGPVSKNEGVMDALCTSCHSVGNIAEKRIPLIATHPKDKLINNIMRCERGAIDYSPLFDEEGNEVNVGNISCPSCHDAHQWSPLAKRKGPGKNLEGNATNSFLRNVSYNNICIDCHGLDALFRYKYFHDPEERVGERRPLRPEVIK
jgi:predicted CXXCH cytochrome family protein